MKNKKIIIGVFSILFAISVLVILGVTSLDSNNIESPKKLNGVLEGKEATIYRSSTCGCCEVYQDELKEEGVDVTSKVQSDLNNIKEKHSIPMSKQSCHTTEIGGYFVEGHVPFEAIEKLITENPEDILGITLPGMPTGTPGMPGPKTSDYKIYALTTSGEWEEYMVI